MALAKLVEQKENLMIKLTDVNKKIDELMELKKQKAKERVESRQKKKEETKLKKELEKVKKESENKIQELSSELQKNQNTDPPKSE